MKSRLALALLASVVVLGFACGDGADNGDDDDGASTSGGEQPALQMPASQFAVTEADLAPWLNSDPAQTFLRNETDYNAFPYFESLEDATTKLKAWGYQGGYSTQFQPEGLYADVLNGYYYVDVEVHLFSTFDGAHNAFEQFVSSTQQAEGLVVLDLAEHGNEHFATKLVSGTVPTSELEAVFHRYIFRRGNLVAVVQTRGAETLMEDTFVADVAQGIDEKALGLRPLETPTPEGEGVPTLPVFDGENPTPINQ